MANHTKQLEFDYSESSVPNLIALEKAAKNRFPLIENYHHSTILKKDYKWENLKQFKVDPYIIFKTGECTYLFLSVVEYENAKPDEFIHGIVVTVKDDRQKATEILKCHLQLHVTPGTSQPILMYRAIDGTARAPIEVLHPACVDTFFILIDHLSFSDPFHETIFGGVTNIHNLAKKYKDMLKSNIANYVNPPTA